MNYILNILLILFIKFYSSEYNNKNLLGVWNLISEIEVTSNNSDKKNPEEIYIWHINYHPDGGQLFFPSDNKRKKVLKFKK